jgi:hypothetical protein
LHLAASKDLDFGRDILFTYGPLGFLAFPVAVTGPTLAGAVLFALVLQIAISLVVLAGATRTFGTPLGVIVAYLVVAAFAGYFFEYVPIVTFYLAVLIVDRLTPPPAAVLVLGGFLAALQLLIKVNGGVLCLGVLMLVAWRARPFSWRAEVILVAAFGCSLVGLWLVTGNTISALGPWLRESKHLLSGYTDAMSYEWPGLGWQ